MAADLRPWSTEAPTEAPTVGERVMAPYPNDHGRRYPGKVSSVAGTLVNILFDDGDKREGVAWKACRCRATGAKRGIKGGGKEVDHSVVAKAAAYFAFRTFCCPLILLFHAARVFCCGCLEVYYRRFSRKVCCRTRREPEGTVQNCWNFCGLCRMLGCFKYTDKDFPPTEESLGIVKGDTASAVAFAASRGVEWVRAGEHEDAELFGDQFFVDGVDPLDVKQGTIGDCWLIAAIACLAEKRGAVQKCFLTKEVNPRGRYRLRLFDGRPKVNSWVDVTVDDCIPCDKVKYEKGEIVPVFSGLAGEEEDIEGGRPPGEAKGKGHDLWVTILEKAFAKFCGSFSALEGGWSEWALRAMTGDLARRFVRRGDKWQRIDLVNLDDDNDPRSADFVHVNEEVDSDNFFKILREYDHQDAVLCCAGAPGPPGTVTRGLIAGHAYSILAVTEVPKTEQGFTGGFFSTAEGFRLIKVRNPHGGGEWVGDWSDKSSLWAEHPAVARACGFVNAEDGAFWMSYEDFSANFSNVGVCDRSIDVENLEYDVVGERTHMGPAIGCAKGCCIFWCTCEGYRRIYFPKKSAEETVAPTIFANCDRCCPCARMLTP